MRLYELLRGVDVLQPHADECMEIPHIVSDSRRARAGCMFLCLRGVRTDGHRYIPQAKEKGAAVAVIDDTACAPADLPYVVVGNTRAAAAQIWNNYYGDPTRDMRVVAITGTNGKTSTSYILRAILAAAGYKTGLIGTVRCLCGDEEIDLGGGGEIADVPAAMTTPDPEFLYGAAAQMRDRGTEVLILEATSHALDLHKVDAMHIDIGIFTNLTPEHMDYHGTMDRYLAAKARLFAMCPVGILLADDPYAAPLTELAPMCRYIRCRVREDAEGDVYALRQQMQGIDGVSYVYYAKNTVFRVKCPVPGQFTVANTMLAITAALRLGIDPLTIQDALRSFSGVEGRMERVILPGAPFTLFLDYAHTPAALETLLRTVRHARREGQKITLLFGCGGDRDPAKRPVMGRIASALADFVILTSDNCRTENPTEILSQIRRGMDREKPHIVLPDRREAIRYAIREAGAGDILLFAGKGHEKYEIDAYGKHPFDEADIARRAYAEITRG